MLDKEYSLFISLGLTGLIDIRDRIKVLFSSLDSSENKLFSMVFLNLNVIGNIKQTFF